jgi:hypothetical protein
MKHIKIMPIALMMAGVTRTNRPKPESENLVSWSISAMNRVALQLASLETITR